MNLKLLLSLPNCYNCKYFLPINKDYKRHTFNDLDKCSYFKYSINNNTIYHFAETCRSDESKCGLNGNHFIDK
jgi:hypothetical protein